MVFLGGTFCAAKNTLDHTATAINNINFILLQNAIFDEIHITKDISFSDNQTISKEWNYDTTIHANFNGNLHGGNVDYSAEQVSHVRIKRRLKGTYNWITLYEIPIHSYQDFLFERFDGLAARKEYEYALVPVMSGVEGNININSIISDFEGIYIVEKDKAFGTILDINLGSIQKNKPTATVVTLGNKYPFVISNGETGYYSGSLSANFMEVDEASCGWKTKEAFDYRERLMEFLENGQPKLIKFDDGRSRIIKIVDSVTEEANGHPENILTSLNYVETGKIDSSTDLYNSNLIDVNIEGS